ncbi:uncharacterized protein [Miscanthus floridulus]|uniref:uncharacterized protein n=1 Tax=Miscanthus floridulus TaxID=154761 RepID=UPI003458CD35
MEPADDMEIPELELPHASAKSKEVKESEEANTAFEQLKLFLTKPLVMTAPQLDETLLIYIAATSRVVSTTIVVECEESGHAYKVQCPLRHYFEYYKIAVVTKFPLGDILRNKEANGRIIKWAIELDTYSIEIRSKPTFKSQALADFVAEWTEIQEPITATCPKHWVMYFDGTLNISGASVGILFITPTKDKLHYVLWIHFPASNNAAEYEACLHGLRIAIEIDIKQLMVYGDSALVINQLNKDWKLEEKFYGIEYHYVVRDQNQPANQLSKIGSSRIAVPLGVFVQDLLVPSIKEEKKVEEVPPTE